MALGMKSPRAEENELLLKHIKRTHAESRGTYGWPRCTLSSRSGSAGGQPQAGRKADGEGGIQGLYRRRRAAAPVGAGGSDLLILGMVDHSPFSSICDGIISSRTAASTRPLGVLGEYAHLRAAGPPSVGIIGLLVIPARLTRQGINDRRPAIATVASRSRTAPTSTRAAPRGRGPRPDAAKTARRSPSPARPSSATTARAGTGPAPTSAASAINGPGPPSNNHRRA